MNTDTTQAALSALGGDETLRTIARRLRMDTRALQSIAESHGVDWEGRKARIHQLGQAKRRASVVAKQKQKAERDTRKWLRDERTMSGDMSSLMGLRMGWV